MLAIFLTSFSVALAYSLRRYIECISSVAIRNPNQPQMYFDYYRQLQILCQYYNLIQQDGLVIASILLLMTGVITSLFTLVSLGFEASGIELSLFCTVFQDGAIVLMVYTTVMGQVNSISIDKTLLVNKTLMSKVMVSRDRKWTRKNMLSLAPLKCRLGYVNYVDVLTPIVMLDFCINQTVSLLMLQ